jgi:small subunit ribosomal protein S20
MPNTKSAEKRMRTSEISRQKNKSVKSNIATVRKKLMQVIEDGKLEDSRKLFNDYSSLLDKAVKNNIVKANAASRSKSRVAVRIKALS